MPDSSSYTAKSCSFPAWPEDQPLFESPCVLLVYLERVSTDRNDQRQKLQPQKLFGEDEHKTCITLKHG